MGLWQMLPPRNFAAKEGAYGDWPKACPRRQSGRQSYTAPPLPARDSQRQWPCHDCGQALPWPLQRGHQRPRTKRHSRASDYSLSGTVLGIGPDQAPARQYASPALPDGLPRSDLRLYTDKPQASCRDDRSGGAILEHLVNVAGNRGVLRAGAGEVGDRDVLLALSTRGLPGDDLPKFSGNTAIPKPGLLRAAQLAQFLGLADAVGDIKIGLHQGLWFNLVLAFLIRPHSSDMQPRMEPFGLQDRLPCRGGGNNQLALRNQFSRIRNSLRLDPQLRRHILGAGLRLGGIAPPD